MKSAEIGKLKSDKEINSNKFMLHEAYCYRHHSKCEHCNEVFNKNELENHIKENHS